MGFFTIVEKNASAVTDEQQTLLGKKSSYQISDTVLKTMEKIEANIIKLQSKLTQGSGIKGQIEVLQTKLKHLQCYLDQRVIDKADLLSNALVKMEECVAASRRGGRASNG